jgi:hypothetical protein
VVLASPSGKDTDRGLIVAHGKFNLAKFKARADEAAQDNPNVLKVHKVPLGAGASHVIYEVVIPGQNFSLFVALASDKTILASPGKDYVVDALKQARAKRKPALKNKEFQAVLEKLDEKQSLSMAVLGKGLTKGGFLENLPKSVQDALADIEVIGGGMTVSNELRLELTVATRTPRAGKELKVLADKGLKLVQVGLMLLDSDHKGVSLLLEVLKTVKVNGKDKVVTVTAKVSADVIADALKAAE